MTIKVKLKNVTYIYYEKGLIYGIFFFARLVDHVETWKYTNGSGWQWRF